jgi:hypothetical protein
MLRALMTAMAGAACLAAGTPHDHAILALAFEHGRSARLDSGSGGEDLATIRIDSFAGEACESRFAISGAGAPAGRIDWRAVRKVALSDSQWAPTLFVTGGVKDHQRLAVSFDDLGDATRVLLAMERIQAACRPAR